MNDDIGHSETVFNSLWLRIRRISDVGIVVCSHRRRILAVESIRPSLQFVSECFGHGDEDEETGAVWKIMQGSADIIQKRVNRLFQRCSILVPHRSTADNADGDQKRAKNVENTVCIKALEKLEVFLGHRSDLFSLLAWDGADATDVLETKNR